MTGTDPADEPDQPAGTPPDDRAQGGGGEGGGGGEDIRDQMRRLIDEFNAASPWSPR